MFNRLAQAVVHHPVLVIIGWLLVIVAVIGGASVALGSGGMSSVTDTQQADFLPAHYQSEQAVKVAERAFPSSNDATAVLVITRSDGGFLTGADQARAVAIARQVGSAGIPGILSVQASRAGLSPNHRVQLAQVQFSGGDGSSQTMAAVTRLRTLTTRLVSGTSLRAGYAGDAPSAADSQSIQELVSGGLAVVVLILLLLVFRSPVIAFLNVLVVAIAGEAATYGLALAAKGFGFHLDPTTTGLLPVVLLGVGTDYTVFLLFRYRERLLTGEDRKTAMTSALARVAKAITSSALVLIVSLCALLLSSLGFFRVVGPALAFAVLVMLATALTLVPAVAVLLGPKVFWPARAWRRPREPRGLAVLAGRTVARHPARTAVGAMLLLAVLGLGTAAFRSSFDQSAAPGGTPSATAQAALQAGFPAGALNPTDVYLTGGRVDPATLDSVIDAMRAQHAVAAIGPVVNGRGATSIQVYLRGDPFGTVAMNAVQHQVLPAAQATAAAHGARAYVGGATATFADVSQALSRDMKLIFPVAAALIGLILLLTLRGLPAAGMLLGSVVLGFLATLGASVLVFQGLAGKPGLEFQLPIVVYLFVTAMGTDYNILMVSRLREELARGHTPRQAADIALRQTGPSVAAAGIILAGSFATLTLNSEVAQVGFAVAAGILLSTFVMSWLLVPALIAWAGRGAFWPSRGQDPGITEVLEPMSALRISNNEWR